MQGLRVSASYFLLFISPIRRGKTYVNTKTWQAVTVLAGYTNRVQNGGEMKRNVPRGANGLADFCGVVCVDLVDPRRSQGKKCQIT